MKVLVIHNFHRSGSASGDDLVYKNEISLLESKGVQVIKYSVKNDEFDNSNIIKKIFLTFGMLWSFKHYRNIKKILQKEKPDIVHVHTFFPILSPSILFPAHKRNCKVIATLHDTRFICPCATSLRGMKLCNQCTDGHYFRMIKYRCFKNSYVQSMIVAFIFGIHRKLKTFYLKIDKYICLNDSQIELLKNAGFDEKKIVKKYNFITDNKYIEDTSKQNRFHERYVVFYGRIGEEKGIRVLMEIWNKIDDIPLIVMGNGPLANEFMEWSKSKTNVIFLGYVKHQECLEIVKCAEFVVFPSIWYEGCSMVEIESQSLGKPIIATNLGFSSEAIIDGYNGKKIQLGNIDEFVYEIKKLWNEKEEIEKMGKNARQDYEKKYMPDKNYYELMAIYNSVCRL